MNSAHSHSDPSALLDPWCRALLARGVRAAGLDSRVLPDAETLAAAFGAVPRFRRWLEASADLLREPVGTDPDALRDDLLRREPALAAHVALAEACAAALPEILAGKLAATDVLFPGGAPNRVEPIYRDNPWADYFNRLTAEACLQAVAARLARWPGQVPRILEIGAGTGGTTGFVLDRLERHRGTFEYVYSDISPGFVQQGRKLFGGRGHRMEFLRLDIEQAATPPLEPAQIIIATNVLHATRRIDRTLANVRALLADDGLLLLNELTRTDAFAALTFGLLDGWWCFEDAEQRLPHGPVLSAAGWRAALARNGFGTPAVYGWNGREDGFQCLFVTTAAAYTRRAQEPQIRIEARNPIATPGLETGTDAAALRRRVREVLARRLGFAPDDIGWEHPFAELGVDSIVAPQFAADLADALGTGVDAMDIYNHGTVAALAGALAERLPRSSTTETRVVSAASGPPGDAIAVIGLACRFAGAPDADAFWDLLAEGRDATAPVGTARWADPGLQLTAGLLPEAECFDPDFFRLSHAEAEVMDPQQRVFLEECWHALEDAGLGSAQLEGRACGVFVGVAAQHHPANQGEARAALGNSNAILAARIAYHLNLKGPAVPVDTACSSSLVAIHLAAQALRNGDCELALAGGVSVLLCNSALPRFLVEAGMVSPTGQCRAFDAGADGFVPGEGVGVVVLRRLDQALAHGDRILGVIRATGINQDGRTSGITAPSGPAQTALLRRVWAQAGIEPASLSLIEAHGTGTPLGDPIEAQALAAAFGARAGNTRLALGSVKPNIGHTLTAAGVASVIKVLLALRERTLPPSLHFHTPNPRLNLEQSPFYVPQQAEAWRAAEPRRAAVSSFGFSGTNAHAVIEEAPPTTAPVTMAGDALLLLSAADQPALVRLARRLAAWLAAHPDTALADLCRSLNAGRAFLAERAAFRVDALAVFRRGLLALAEGRADPALIHVGGLLGEAGAVWRIAPGDDLTRLGAHFVAGGLADWERLGVGGRVLSLPGYPFARDRFPLPGDAATDGHGAALDALVPGGDPAFADHVWDGRAIVPATALLWLAAQALGGRACLIEAVRWHRPLTADGREARFVLQADGRVVLESAEGRHAEARARPARTEERPQLALPAALPETWNHAAVYQRFAALGFAYGPLFRVVQGIATTPGRAGSRLAWPDGVPASRHPAIGLLDGMIQSALGLLDSGEQPVTVVPIGLGRAWIDPAALAAPLRVEVRAVGDAAASGERHLDVVAWNAAGEVAARLEGLAVRVSEAGDPIQPLLYRPAWRRAELAAGFQPLREVTVLLFDHSATTPPALSGQTCILVTPGPAFRALADHRYELPPGDPAALSALAQALAGRGLHPDVWLNLWPRTQADDDAATRLALGPLTLLHGLRSWLPRRDASRTLRVVQVGPAAKDADPAQAATAGLFHALAGEEPRFMGNTLALPEGVDPWPILLAELAEAEGAGEILLDAEGHRHVRAYVPVPESGGVADPLAHAVCLITGGLGGLGLALAAHLWRTRRAKLALLGRTPPQERAAQVLAALRAEGADILELRADLNDTAALATALADIRVRWGAIQAVFHLAGVQADGFLRGLPVDVPERVLAPKIGGTLALLSALAGSPVRLWVGFGSLAGAFGAPGQAPYAAANRAMDALLERAAHEHPDWRVLALDWGYWALDGGMAVRDRDAASVQASTGLTGFTPEQGMALLDRVLAAPVSGRLLLAQGRRAVFEAFMAGSGPSVPATPPAAAPEDFLAYLTGIVAEITHTPAQRLGPDRALDEFGIDSIMITRLNARLERDLGRISKTLFFEHPTLRSLAAYLARQYGGVRPQVRAAASPPPVPDADPAAIAIVGMAGRFPEAGDLDAYWRNLLAGRVCIREIPAGRWPLAGFYDPDPQRAGTSYAKWGGFIEGVDRFDPLFFNIAPDEAARMDPQERLFLETAWQCLEDAGSTRAGFGPAGEREVGVYVGVMYGDYQLLAHDAAAGQGTIGGAAPYWSIANRVSYALGLEGPSLAVDSACSSSLTALHLACQAIAAGDCRAALVGGVNLSLHPDKYIGLSQGRFASSDGRCRSFGAGGDGYVPGEGVAAVLLKPLTAALAAGDVIHGVIRATAINHGGRTNGYTVPNPAAQAAAIRRALRRAGLSGTELGYIEAHGTGTRLGDPIEIEGLVQALGGNVPPGAIPLGSAKAAIGHLEAAAGVAGLIKVLLQMRHGRYAPLPLAGPVNPDIDFAATPLRLQTTAAAWPTAADGRRYAGVSSFGAGGANAHVIVQDPPPRPARTADGFARVVPLSARTEAQVRALAGALAGHLAGREPPPTLADLCHTLTIGRESLRCRCAFVAQDRDHARNLLAAIAERREGGGVVWGEAPDDSGAAPAQPGGGDLPALAEFWCRGGAALWPQDGTRISLAARPFLGGRHWLRATPPIPVSVPPVPGDWTRQPRPLREGEQAAWLFTLPPDSTLLSQHIVGGERLLPGAAIVAMALELEPAGLKELTWMQSIRAGAAPLRLDFSLRSTAAGTAFTVRAGDDPAVLAAGVMGAVSGAMAVSELPAGAGAVVEAGDFYRRLAELGLEYGGRFQGVRRLWPDAVLARAELAIPDHASPALDPAWLDGAFQTLAGLLPDLRRAVRGEGVPVPYTLGSVAVFGDWRQVREVRARRLSAPDAPVQRFALALVDAAGRPVLSVGELTARRRILAPVATPPTLLKPIWVARPVQGPRPGRALVLVAPGAESLAAELAGRFLDAPVLAFDAALPTGLALAGRTLYYLDTAEGAVPPPEGDAGIWAEAAASRSLRLLAVLRRLAAGPEGRSIQRMVIVTRGVYAVHAAPGLERASDAAGLHGLAKAAAREWPGIPVVAVDLPAEGDGRALDRLAAEPGDSAGAEIAYRQGRRYVRRLRPVVVAGESRLPLEQGGTCLIVGGMGGVGRTLAEHWAREFGARIVLVGRRPAAADSAGFTAKLRTLGGDGLYLQADASDPAAFAAAVAQAEAAFGPIQIAAQSALALRDKTLALMDEADFRAAFAPRAAVGAAFLAAFAARPPRCLLLFSSANLFLGQHGQGNYVAGNAALAALGQAARARGWPVHLVHWGLWGEVGAVADPAIQARFSAEGVLPITPDLGAALLPMALAAGADIAAVRVEPARLAALEWVERQAWRRAEPTGPAPTAPALAAQLARAVPVDESIAAAGTAFAILERYGLARVAGMFRALAGAAAQRRLTPARLWRELGVVPDYTRLVLALLRRLAELGWVEERDGLWRLAGAETPDLDRYRAELDGWTQDRPWLAANRDLLESCLDAYPAVLRGERAGSAVLFPDGDTRRVAVAYQGNPISDRANALLVAAVVAEVEARLKATPGPVHLLEVGAGTGGSTLPVLAGLRSWRERVRYHATDISPYLAQRLRGRCAEEGWEIEAAALDITRAPGPEDTARYDLIIAANVVHATPDIAATLSHLRTRLAAGGRLLLNELTARRDLGTLIFGLTPQWWMADDPELRLPDSPALAPEAWRGVLAETGWIEPLSIGVEGEAETSGQSLVTALADAWNPVGPDSEAASPSVPAPAVPAATPAPPRLAEGTARDGLEPMLDYLKRLFTAVLGVDPSEMRPGDTFERYGVESLSALEIRNRIAADYPAVSSTLLFEHNTLRRLAEHLLTLGVPAQPHRTPPPQDLPPAPAPSVAEDAESQPAPPVRAEPIAVIGFAGRFPGADTPEALWTLLREGGSALGPVPADRWDAERYLDRGAGKVPAPGHCRSRWGGFLEGIDRFDPLFFGIPPLEAETMDPQERLFIETCWNALEDAGTTPARLADQARATGAPGSVGVFCGVMNTAYQWLAAEAWRAGEDRAASSHFWSIPNRVSYLFDFDGPSLAVDTACSSSLTALHLACESLRRGECGAALVGGVNLIAHPRQLVNLGQAGMIAAGAECRAFGAGADGFVDGEGVGVLVLKPWSRALADGDRIDGLIVGSALNAGGKTGGFTVPNPRAQTAVIRAALDQAGIGADGLCLIETHGTGTELGDPIEVAGLLAALKDPAPAQRLPLGTLKANIGHLEAAAGIASLIKVLLQLRHATIAPARHAATPNPLIPWPDAPFRLPADAEPWPQPPHRPRRAAVSGFGAGGANAHVIVEAAPATPRRAVPASPEHLPLTAKTPRLLAELAGRMAEAVAGLAPRHAGGDTRTLLADIGRTLREGRVGQAHTLWFAAHDVDEFVAALRAVARGGIPPEPARPPVEPPCDPRARPVSLPTSPFDRQRYWLDVEPAPPGGVPGVRPAVADAGHATPPATATQLLGLEWMPDPVPTAGASPSRTILLIGGGAALAADLAGLGHAVERLSAAGTEWQTTLAHAGEPCWVVVDGRGGDAAGPMLRAALDIARRVVGTAGPGRLLHIASLGADGQPLPASIAIAALFRSLVLENPACSAAAVAMAQPTAAAIAAELAALDRPGSYGVRYLGAERQQLAIAPPAAGSARPLPGFREGGSYVLVGGLGEVGRPLAQVLVRRYRARVAILGRTAPDAQVQARWAELGSSGSIRYVRCDINDRADLAAALAQVAEFQGGIDGVLHLARKVAPAPLHALRLEDAAATLAPKVEGSLNLLGALAAYRPDWLILFSSLAAWAGQAGGADYAAACAFQDGLALAAGPMPTPVLAVAWPQWEHDLYLDAAKRQQWSALDLATLDIEAGLDALENLLRQGPGAYGVLHGADSALARLAERLPGYRAAPSWAGQLAGWDAATLRAYRDYLRAEGLAPPTLDSPQDPPASAADTFAAEVLAVCAEYLKIAPDLLAQASFAELGLDSIRALHLAERLQRCLQRPVEPVMLFQHPTIARLSEALATAGAHP
ncbi:Acyl transferase domain-containing protein [Methylomagnum ishizawai]|uniref:Acyl transferase domain-containing protein n=1 Tax=Methylomagnum ishizawai TaxID=1760988 RepID=A0A1Y6D500_9GAMM|nr:SDR family NAD(P)-dependent oxidoreductase [Methylomagnum ishizawai]SMF97500.1 Acyl transferase domain-containing protein [Methylomagnum ishizawai]